MVQQFSKLLNLIYYLSFFIRSFTKHYVLFELLFRYESEEDEVISIDCLKPEYHDNSFDEAYRLTMATNVQSEWDRSCALAKEKDLYMR